MVVAVTKDIPKGELIISSSQGDETIYDPHVWHSIAHWKYVIPPMIKTIVEFDTLNYQYYQANSIAFNDKLLSLNNEITYIFPI